MEGLCEDCKKGNGDNHHGAIAKYRGHESEEEEEYDETEDNEEEMYQNEERHPRSINQFKRKVDNLRRYKAPNYRHIDINQLHRTLYEALLFPELAKGVKFPARKNIIKNSIPNPDLYFSTKEFIHDSDKRKWKCTCSG
jgi:hypothetical protein